MAYKIVSQPKAWWPVRFNGVSEEGEIVENGFEMRFVLLDEDENLVLERDIIALSETAASAGETSFSALATPIVQRIAEDWRGVTEDDGTDDGRSLPFVTENIARMLRVPNVLGAIATAYRAARAAEPERRKGN